MAINNDITIFAETNFRNQRRRFGIKLDDRRRHMYVVGKTGMGKSTLLENMIINDIQNNKGIALVDPHGDLAEKVINFIPNSRVNDVIYFNPSDTQYPVAFNILENVSPDYKHLVAYGLIGVFKKIWADSWGPRLEYILTNTILALLDYPGSTLLGVMRMLVDKSYRKKVVSEVSDPVVKTFWAEEFANYSEKFRTEAIAPIQNKVGQFLSSSIIRNIVGQSKSTIEMRDIMDQKKILIMNLAKGRIGEENSALLGAMMITKLQIAAMSRVDIAEEERSDFYLYVDEFQNFATDSFAGILSEARKYRLCLIMAHQYIEQLGDVVKAAVFGNVGTMLIFRVGATDALEIEPEFAPRFMAVDIMNLNKYNFIMRLMIDGVATEPFSAIGLAPSSGSTENRDKVVKVSRERYARPQALVEDRIIRWSGVEIKTSAPVDSGDATVKNQTEATPEEAEPVKTEYDTLNDLLKGPQSLIPGSQPTALPQTSTVQTSAPMPPTAPIVATITQEASSDPDEPLSIKPKVNFVVTKLSQLNKEKETEVAPKPVNISHTSSVPTPPSSSSSSNVNQQPTPQKNPVTSPPAKPTPVSTPAPKVSATPPPPASTIPPTVPKKNDTPSPSPDKQSAGLSLQDLKTGSVTPINFNGQPVRKSEAPSASAPQSKLPNVQSNPSPQRAESTPGNPSSKRRRRNRNKSMQNQSQSSAPSTSTQNQRPPQSVQKSTPPNPPVTPPQPKPVQSAQPPKDNTSVNLKDFI